MAAAPAHGRHWASVRRFSCMWVTRCWVSAIVSQSIVLFNALKWAAAAYLLYIGFKALRAQPAKPAAEGELHREAGERTPRGAFTAGFVTNGLNPKATLFSCRCLPW